MERRKPLPDLARERIGPRGAGSRQSGRRQSRDGVRSVGQTGRTSCARFPNERSRRSTWSTWWPAATVFPAGGTGASIRPTAGDRYAAKDTRRMHSGRRSDEYHRVEAIAVCRWRFHSRRPPGRCRPIPRVTPSRFPTPPIDRAATSGRVARSP